MSTQGTAHATGAPSAPPSALPPARWWVLALLAIAIGGNYYEYDVIAPIAEILRTERGFTQSQIGMLNAVFSLPNIFLALLGGIMIDHFGASRVAVWSAVLGCIGATLTAIGDPYGIMVTGRLLFGLAEEALFIALLASLAQWFAGGGMALAMALFFSLARIGSYAADTSPTWARSLYAQGWQVPLWLGVGVMGVSLLATLIFRSLDRRANLPTAPKPAEIQQRFAWSDLWNFSRSFWYILTLNVLFASMFFPFRSTFSIVYFQDVKGLTLQQAGQTNSWVFFAAIFATPVFGLIADRYGRRALIMMLAMALMPLTFLVLGATDWDLRITTVMMGIAFSAVPAIIWAATAMLVEPRRLGTAYGLINMLQALGLAAGNLGAGWLNDVYRAGPHNPSGYDAMLWFFGAIAFVAFASVAALWWRERGAESHGLETFRVR
jgi:MFS family permease